MCRDGQRRSAPPKQLTGPTGHRGGLKYVHVSVGSGDLVFWIERFLETLEMLNRGHAKLTGSVNDHTSSAYETG